MTKQRLADLLRAIAHRIAPAPPIRIVVKFPLPPNLGGLDDLFGTARPRDPQT